MSESIPDLYINFTSQNDLTQVEIGKVLSSLACVCSVSKSIDISYLAIERFPEELLDVKLLIRLNLSNNQISSLPDGIQSLEHLEVLSLDNNHLDCLPPGVTKLPNLKYLDVEGNSLNPEAKVIIQSLKDAGVTVCHDDFDEEDSDE